MWANTDARTPHAPCVRESRAQRCIRERSAPVFGARSFAGGETQGMAPWRANTHLPMPARGAINLSAMGVRPLWRRRHMLISRDRPLRPRSCLECARGAMRHHRHALATKACAAATSPPSPHAPLGARDHTTTTCAPHGAGSERRPWWPNGVCVCVWPAQVALPHDIRPQGRWPPPRASTRPACRRCCHTCGPSRYGA